MRVTEEMHGDHARLKSDFNGAAQRLEELVCAIFDTVDTISSRVGEISGATDNLSQRTEQQAAGLEEAAAAIDEITARPAKRPRKAPITRATSSPLRRRRREGG